MGFNKCVVYCMAHYIPTVFTPPPITSEPVTTTDVFCDSYWFSLVIFRFLAELTTFETITADLKLTSFLYLDYIPMHYKRKGGASARFR